MARTGETTGYGYDVLTPDVGKGEFPRLRKFIIPNSHRHIILRDGSVGFCLIHFALWWDEKINPLDANPVWDEWGYAVRPTRGKTSGFSEHAGGSAADLDATEHPRGVPLLRGFKPATILKIRRRVNWYQGTLSWGGNYQRTVDGMHIERAPGVSMAQMEKQAHRLFETNRGRRILAANPGLKAVILS